MTLKHRYAASLLGVLLLLAAFSVATVLLLQRGHYVIMALLFVLIYLCFVTLGKRLSKVFFILSFIKHLKKQNGIVSYAQFDAFIRNTMRTKKSTGDLDIFIEDVLQTMVREKIVVLENDQLTLIDH